MYNWVDRSIPSEYSLSSALVQFHGVELKESVFEVVGVVGDPGVAVSAGFSSTLRIPVTGATSPATAESDVDDLTLRKS